MQLIKDENGEYRQYHEDEDIADEFRNEEIDYEAMADDWWDWSKLEDLDDLFKGTYGNDYYLAYLEEEEKKELFKSIMLTFYDRFLMKAIKEMNDYEFLLIESLQEHLKEVLDRYYLEKSEEVKKWGQRIDNRKKHYPY